MKNKRSAGREDLGLTKAEFAILRRLKTPEKIQAYLDAIPQNFEIGGETCLSVREALGQRRALCIEGAVIAAAALWVHGEPPLLMDLKAERDSDHVVALFRRNGCWGAISKTNHPILRWRDPVYRSLRELAMSYFHEYCNKRQQKTLRSYSAAFDLRRLDPATWVTQKKSCWDLGWALDAARHYPLIARKQVKLLRLRDPLEREAQKLCLHKPPRRK
ncbi:MAG: hypothetical protein D4R74_09495 [Betaproteobacteria bacterium]|nr:MAG: hypothetical protein D4R74_09495 [Betaproteobacteria bacterium]